ncbi:60S ribosomal protein L26 [Entamoeba marina]
MKFNTRVSSNPSKARKAYYTAPAHKRSVFMSARLSEELRKKYNVVAVPIHRDDEVKVLKGHNKVAGKVTAVRRSRYVINIDKLTRTKINGQTVSIPIKPSNVVITKLFLNKDREEMLKKKGEGRQAYKEIQTKREQEVENIFKQTYPELSMDIFGKKIEPTIVKKVNTKVPAKLLGEKFLNKANLKAYRKRISVNTEKSKLSAYKAALAKKISK